MVAAFSARYPNIVVDLNLGDEVVDILGGQADVAVRFGHLPDSPLTARRIGTTGQVVVASPEYLQRHGIPQEPEDLLQHNCLRFNFRRAEPNWPFIRDGKSFALKVSGNIECSSGEALAQFAQMGAGIARIGEFSVSEDLQRGDLIALLQAWNPGTRNRFMRCSSAARRCRRGCDCSWTSWWNITGCQPRRKLIFADIREAEFNTCRSGERGSTEHQTDTGSPTFSPYEALRIVAVDQASMVSLSDL